MSKINCSRNVLQFISDEINLRHQIPSQREIADALFISKGTVQRCLEELEEMGFVSSVPGKARSLTLLKDPTQFPTNNYWR